MNQREETKFNIKKVIMLFLTFLFSICNICSQKILLGESETEIRKQVLALEKVYLDGDYGLVTKDYTGNLLCYWLNSNGICKRMTLIVRDREQAMDKIRSDISKTYKTIVPYKLWMIQIGDSLKWEVIYNETDETYSFNWTLWTNVFAE